MRSFFIAAAALCSIVSAAPAAIPDSLVPPPPGTALFRLQAKSTVTALNGQYVTLKTGATQYSLGTALASAAQFFYDQYPPTGTYSFRNSDDTRQLALQGPNGVLLNLIEVVNPSSSSIPGGQLMEWGTFTIEGSVLGVNDGSTLKNRTFVAVKQGTGYDVAFYDGVSNTTAAVTPITLSILKV
ncbi:hypothetical protein P154DRAFT_474736 [Amniculicola lignicola CBS 123094]|uniref:Uncharacterized protein n=1 Tax=Amniculicola lignicola CBS 123094 TaxID=1392246 RepID=A0A6A5W1T1_9PLEO|nr:hypothetical protein P154DRAFT_474736 [Amniculicola lignicola CBS 123094]